MAEFSGKKSNSSISGNFVQYLAKAEFINTFNELSSSNFKAITSDTSLKSTTFSLLDGGGIWDKGVLVNLDLAKVIATNQKILSERFKLLSPAKKRKTCSDCIIKDHSGDTDSENYFEYLKKN